MSERTILSAVGLTKDFVGGGAMMSLSPRSRTRAVDNVDFVLNRGETLALVGESGSGKTTLARMVLGLETPTAGTIMLDGVDYSRASAPKLRKVRQQLQMVFQDPYGSLHPRRRIGPAVAEPWRIHRKFTPAERRVRAAELLESVGLSAEYVNRYPNELSGGQRQRVAIARALALEPRVLVLDEPVSSLDISIQAQILNLLMDLQAERELAFLLISHDLPLVRLLADRVAVMSKGSIVESGDAREVYERPEHPYTKRLLDSM